MNRRSYSLCLCAGLHESLRPKPAGRGYLNGTEAAMSVYPLDTLPSALRNSREHSLSPPLLHFGFPVTEDDIERFVEENGLYSDMEESEYDTAEDEIRDEEGEDVEFSTTAIRVGSGPDSSVRDQDLSKMGEPVPPTSSIDNTPGPEQAANEKPEPHHDLSKEDQEKPDITPNTNEEPQAQTEVIEASSHLPVANAIGSAPGSSPPNPLWETLSKINTFILESGIKSFKPHYVTITLPPQTTVTVSSPSSPDSSETPKPSQTSSFISLTTSWDSEFNMPTQEDIDKFLAMWPNTYDSAGKVIPSEKPKPKWYPDYMWGIWRSRVNNVGSRDGKPPQRGLVRPTNLGIKVW